MYKLRRRGPGGFEDLMQELEVIEQNLIKQGENGSAMDLMVLETKIRDHVRTLERRVGLGSYLIGDPNAKNEDVSLDDIQALIPVDLPPFPSMTEVSETQQSKKRTETMAIAALLAMGTALGVFGLASFLKMALGWII